MNKVAICLECKKEFSVPNWRLGKAKYCSYDCANKGRTSDKSYNKPRICVGCGKEFFPTNWTQKFCDRKCFCKSEKKTGAVKCRTCGKEFIQTRIEQKFCSRKCSNPYKDKKLKKPKQEGLDNLWSRLVKEKAGNKCEYCDKNSGLNSHHVFSRSNKRVRWDLDNGVCVCVLHHIFGLFSAHKAPIEFVEWLKDYRGEDWYNQLRVKARVNGKFTKEDEEIVRNKLKTKALLEPSNAVGVDKFVM